MDEFRALTGASIGLQWQLIFGVSKTLPTRKHIKETSQREKMHELGIKRAILQVSEVLVLRQ